MSAAPPDKKKGLNTGLVFAMFLSPMDIRAVTTGVVLILVALAAREDLLRQRIPNGLNAAGLIVGVSMASFAAGLSGFVDSVCGALVGCAALVPFYLLRGMGAGDAKLMGAAGAFLGSSSALLAALLALMAGGVLALAVIVWRLVEPRPVWEPLAAGDASALRRAATTISIVRKERFPYAVAIAIGVVGTLWLKGSLWQLYSALGIG